MDNTNATKHEPTGGITGNDTGIMKAVGLAFNLLDVVRIRRNKHVPLHLRGKRARIVARSFSDVMSDDKTRIGTLEPLYTVILKRGEAPGVGFPHNLLHYPHFDKRRGK